MVGRVLLRLVLVFIRSRTFFLLHVLQQCFAWPVQVTVVNDISCEFDASRRGLLQGAKLIDIDPLRFNFMRALPIRFKSPFDVDDTFSTVEGQEALTSPAAATTTIRTTDKVKKTA